MPEQLTAQRRQIRDDLRDVIDELGFDYENILETRKEYRSIALYRIRVTTIRGVIVEKHVMISATTMDRQCRPQLVLTKCELRAN